MINLRGTGVAMVTPFDAEGKVDYLALEKLTHHLISGGVNYLVVQGTTGETATLNSEEKQKVLATVIDANQGQLPIVLGLGGNNTASILEAFKNTAYFQGVDAILSVSPYYSKPTQEGIYQHFKTIAEHSPVPVVMYNVPGRTGSNMLPETTLRLANESNIIAIKEASGNMEQIMEIIANKPNDFLIISGDDPLVYPLICAGADGVISVIGNAFPKHFSDMVMNALQGQFQVAKTLHYQCLPIIPKLFAEGNPAGVKAVLEQLGICEAHVRLPLVAASESLREKLKSLSQGLN